MTNDASSEARNSAAAATSSGLAAPAEQVLVLEPVEHRPQPTVLQRRGHRRLDHARAQAVDAHVVRARSRPPCCASATRRRPSTRCTRSATGRPRCPRRSRGSRCCPRPAPPFPGSTARATSHVPLRLMSSTRSHSASSIVSAVPKLDTPAAFTNTSIGPSCATMPSTAAVDRRRVAHVGRDERVARMRVGHGDVDPADARPFVDESARARGADPRPRARHQRDLALESSGHGSTVPFAAAM